MADFSGRRLLPDLFIARISRKLFFAASSFASVPRSLSASHANSPTLAHYQLSIW
jgi:hypothetical protein